MRAAFLKLHTAVFLAGFTAILGKLISLNEIPLVWWRLLFTVLALLPILFLLRKKMFSPNKQAVWQFISIGFLVGLHWLAFFGCIKHAGVSIALVCLSASGFFSSLVEPLLLKHKWKPMDSFFGLLCIAGIYIIFQFTQTSWWGLCLGLASAFSGAMFSIMNKKMVVRKVDGLVLTFWEMLGAFVVVSLLALAVRGSWAFWPVGLDWLWILILALLCSVWAFFLQLQALQYISAATLNLTYNLEPVYGILLAFLIFKENKYLGAGFALGVSIIGLAVAMQSYLFIKHNRISSLLKEKR